MYIGKDFHNKINYKGIKSNLNISYNLAYRTQSSKAHIMALGFVKSHDVELYLTLHTMCYIIKLIKSIVPIMWFSATYAKIHFVL